MKTKIKRILALILAVIIIGMLCMTLYFAFTGSKYFMASMIATLTLPLLLYAYMFIYKLLKGDDDQKQK